jgi:N-acyl-D-amino-acid deacylase
MVVFDEFVKRLDDSEYILKLRELTESGQEPGWESKVFLIGYENIVIGSAVRSELKAFEGLSIIQGAKLLHITEFDFLLYLVLEDSGQTNVIMFQQSEEDNNKVFQFALQMVGSDSIPRAGGKPHPRGYGTFPKVVGRMVKDNVLTLEQAVRKTTGLTAERFGIADRGLLKVGMKADLALFGEEFLDTATFEDPTQQPKGLSGVWINGVRVVEDGRGLEDLPGQVITIPRTTNL